MKKIILLMFIGCFCTSLFAQKIITGTVRDASDNLNTLPGVSIQVKGTKKGTVTDFDGNYSITVQPGDKDLVFSFIGMKSQTVSIGNKSKIDVTLDSDANVLSEVVVSALGIKRENRSLTVAQQRVDAETMAEVRDQNIVSALAGKVAGVMVTPPPSSTGSARIVIRGNSSFTGNNQPLFVIDGMQIDNNDGSNGVNKNGGLDMGNGASDINPDDIESIDVLKGPNAAALYGSRAANGVIIITTKKAKDGRFKVSAASNAMFRYISQWPKFQNAFGIGHMSQMIGGNHTVFETEDADGNLYPYPGIPSMQKMMNTIATRSNGGPQVGQPYIGLDGLMHTYSPQPGNVYDFYQKASTFTNNVAVEGGNVDNNYRASFTNFSADDVVEKQNLVDKNTITARFFNTLIKNLTLDSKVTFINEDTKNRRYSNQSDFNPLYMYTIMPRTMTLDQLKYYKTSNGTESVRVGDIHNPYWTINETSNEDKKTRILANFDLSYQILPSLRASVKYGREYIEVKSNEFRNKGAIGSVDAINGFYKNQINVTDNDMYEWLLVYNQRFNDFSVVGTLGGSQLNYSGYWSNSEIRTLKQAGFAHISNSNDPPRADGSSSRKRINSLYGSASFGYRDFVYLDITGRNDWSSTLPAANNSYFYPSIGVSWIPTEMFKIPSRLFYGKLRASYAQVGNDTSPYNLIPYFNFDADNVFNGYKYASFSETLPNSNLKPEITSSYEIGADLRFLNGRINADITYYKSNSIDQIVRAQMAASSGYAWKMYNAGEIENKGWEVALRVIPVETKVFDWGIDVNFTKNSSMIKSMVEGADRIELGEVFSLKNVVAQGYPYGSMFGTIWLTDQQGRRMVNTANGEPVRKENAYLGNFNPDFLLGISNRFRYKDFDLYVLLDMKKGGKLYSGTMRQAIRNGEISGLEKYHESYWEREVIFGDIGDYRWGGVQFNENGTTEFNNQNIYYYNPDMYDNMENMNPKDPNYVPQQCDRYFWPGNVGYYADGYDNLVIYDASFVKLREISVGYNLPKKLISKIKMTNARISLVGRNLWVFYQKTPKGLDPEAALNAGNGQGLESGSLPPTTTLGFDIKIAF
ncbi:MAG: SusC/RagA family TonB-linked outer membrane protein [Candidatus Symbiothrix sp.]|jgi:TonB-linked SusC/RagA family outer membrane protein|nr:SusC/RagA family TonB-linked outer membrane protein [Candidatus Symbiothrix sp.]